MKKIGSATRNTVKKAGVLMKKADKGAGKAVSAFQKQWKKEGPEREKYIKNIKKVSGDVFDVIRKDINEIRNNNKGKGK